MEQDFDIKHWDNGACPKVDCKKKTCKCGLEKVFLPVVLGDDSKDSPIAPKNGAYCDAVVVYEANNHIYIYSKDGIPTLITSGGGGDYDEIIKEIQEDLAKTENDLAKEVLDRTAGDKTLQDEIDEIKNSPDVVDIVATYAALQSYDTSKLGDNDIVRVLQDEQHDGQSTYYRWNANTQSWTYIGAVGDYYTKGQVDTLLADKQNELTAGSNIAITQSGDDLVISATDTTYSNFVGTDGVTAGSAGLVPAPATTDAGKFLKADGTWDTTGGPNIVRALTTDDYNYPTNNPNSVNPGMLAPGMYFVNDSSLNVYNGVNRLTNRNNIVFIVSGTAGDPTNTHEMAVIDGTNGASSDTYKIGFYYVDVATGTTTSRGDLLDKTYIVNNLTTNNSNRILSAAQGKVLKDALDGRIKTNAGAPTTTTAGTVGQLIEDTTNGKLYICTDATNPYVWEEVGAGGPTVVQAIGNSTTDVMSQDAVAKAIYDTVDSTRGYRPKIGYQSFTGGLQSVAFGDDAKANGVNAVAVGGTTTATQNGAIALGYGARTNSIGEMNIGTSNTSYGYSSSNYRLLSGVYDAQGDHDAVTLGQLNGRVKQNAGAPTTSTVGTVGQLLEDTTNGKLYQCTAVDTTDPQNPSYTWTEVGAGGGGPTVVQTTGTSQTDVMSQNATSSMVFADPSTREKIQIGDGSSAGGTNSISIGKNAIASTQDGIYIGRSYNPSTNGAFGSRSICVGYNSSCDSNSAISIGQSSGTLAGYEVSLGSNAKSANSQCVGSVNLGAYSKCTRAGEVNVGTGTSGIGYNSTDYRVIGGVHDPVDAHDAATKGYVDAHSGGGSSPIQVLTDNDLNWDSSGSEGDPDSVATWLLDTGWYMVDENSSFLVYVNSDDMEDLLLGTIFHVNSGIVMALYPDIYNNGANCGLRIYASDISTGETYEEPKNINFSNLEYAMNNSEEALNRIQVNPSVPTTTTWGEVGYLYSCTANGKLYMCTAIDETDPDNPVYTWTMIN